MPCFGEYTRRADETHTRAVRYTYELLVESSRREEEEDEKNRLRTNKTEYPETRNLDWFYLSKLLRESGLVDHSRLNGKEGIERRRVEEQEEA